MTKAELIKSTINFHSNFDLIAGDAINDSIIALEHTFDDLSITGIFSPLVNQKKENAKQVLKSFLYDYYFP